MDESQKLPQSLRDILERDLPDVEAIMRWLERHGDIDALRRYARELGGPDGLPQSSEQIARYIARHMTRLRGGLQRRASMFSVPTTMTSSAVSDDEVERTKPREAIVDWKIECAHHAALTRPVVTQPTLLEVVPDQGETVDHIILSWRDDHRSSMPPELSLVSGTESTAIARGTVAGGYTSYAFDVMAPEPWKYSPLSVEFWKAISAPRSYTVRGGPCPIIVKSHDPSQWKIELTFPALRKFEAGCKFSKPVPTSKGKGVREKMTMETEFKKAAWSPTSKYYGSVAASDDAAGVVLSEMKHQTISISRDGHKLELDKLEYIDNIMRTMQAILDIIKGVQEYAPKWGWYAQFNIQFLQGKLTAEWYWKEAEDHRAFRYVDIGGAIDLIGISFEIGVGLSAAGFEAQIYAAFSWSLGLECHATRDRPDATSGIPLQSKSTVEGSVGFRAAAGTIVKCNGQIKSSIVFDYTIGINLPDRREIFSVDGGYTFMGLEGSLMFSTGLFSIGGSAVMATATKKFIEPRPRVPFSLFAPAKKYTPPVLSHHAIKSKLVEVLSKDWDIRVFTTSGSAWTPDRRWSLDEIAELLATRIDRDGAFCRKPEVVDAIANSIRKDLDVLGEKEWQRDWIDAKIFHAYVNGPRIAAHLENAAI